MDFKSHIERFQTVEQGFGISKLGSKPIKINGLAMPKLKSEGRPTCQIKIGVGECLCQRREYLLLRFAQYFSVNAGLSRHHAFRLHF